MTIISGLPDDTVQACRDRIETDPAITFIRAAYYVNGHGAPHFPLPALTWPMAMLEPSRSDIMLATLEELHSLP